VAGGLAGPGRVVRRHAVAGRLTWAQRAKFPNLWQYRAFSVDPADRGLVPDALRGQLVATERDAAGTLLAATGVQIPGALDDLYAGAVSARLGPTFDRGRPTLAVWAPTPPAG